MTSDYWKMCPSIVISVLCNWGDRRLRIHRQSELTPEQILLLRVVRQTYHKNWFLCPEFVKFKLMYVIRHDTTYLCLAVCLEQNFLITHWAAGTNLVVLQMSVVCLTNGTSWRHFMAIFKYFSPVRFSGRRGQISRLCSMGLGLKDKVNWIVGGGGSGLSFPSTQSARLAPRSTMRLYSYVRWNFISRVIALAITTRTQ